jgi:hypothetical protein
MVYLDFGRNIWMYYRPPFQCKRMVVIDFLLPIVRIQLVYVNLDSNKAPI